MTARSLPLTVRGARTRLRIVEAAAALIHARSAGRVSLDEVMEASGTSKSQLYHYFADKDDLVREVIALQTQRIVEASTIHFDQLDCLDALRDWRDAMLKANLAAGYGGCPIGSLANELATESEAARTHLAQSFEAWTAVISKGLERMKAKGRIAPTADTQAIAIGVLAAIQGGILLSKSARSSRPLELAFDMALSHLERHSV